MGMDQDDIVLAPWTTIKYPREPAPRSTNTQSERPRQRAASSDQHTINTLNNLYPVDHGALFDAPSATQTADTPQPVRFTNVDQILAKARRRRRDPAGHRPDHGAVARAAPHRVRPGRRLQHPRHDRNHQDLGSASQTDGHVAAGRGHDLAGRRRRGHHEHHAGLGHRADAGNRPADGRRRPQPPHPAAVPRRGRGVVPVRRGPGHPARPRHVDPGAIDSSTGPPKPRCRRSSRPSPSRRRWAWSSASIPPGRPRGWTPSKPCGTSEEPHVSRPPVPTARRSPRWTFPAGSWATSICCGGWDAGRWPKSIWPSRSG